MSDGLGAGFGALLLLAVLTVGAGLLGVATVVAVAVARRRGRVPALVRHVPVLLLAGVVAVAGFGVAALADEAPPVAALFVVVVGLPLVLVAGRVRRAGTAWVAVAAISAMAWSLPFLAGVGVLFALTVATGASPVAMTVLAGTTVVVGALLVGETLLDVLGADLEPPAGR